jgi:hypothetical protein
MSELSQRLAAAARRTDPSADAAVREIGPRIWAINTLLAPLSNHDDVLPAAVPAAIARLVVPELPEWADPHRLRSAQAFTERHLSAITVALFCAALPASYGEPDGAKVLAGTGRMQSDIDRRVNETARFVFDVLRPQSFDRGGRARLAVGRVRLVHAAVRHALIERGTVSGTPIDQEQMLGTLLLFSVVVLDAIERLGVSVSRRDAEDYLHLWCVVGAMMGIDPELLPGSRDEATRLLREVRRRRFAPSDAGRALMQDLLRGMERHVSPMLAAAPRHLVHHLLGPDVAQLLGVPRAGHFARRALALLLPQSPRENAAPSPAMIALSRALLEGICGYKLKGARVTFPMPVTLPVTKQEPSKNHAL